MREESDRRYLKFICEMIGLVQARAAHGKLALFADIDVRDATVRRLEVLAEATGRLSPDLKQRHPDIRWRAIYGFRNIAAHAYLDLRMDRVWQIVETHLPALRAVVDAELARSDGGR